MTAPLVERLGARQPVSRAPLSARNPPPAVFRVRGLSKIYRMGDVQVHALRSVDLELYRGELLVLLGASGSGKSTLLNILGGLDVPTGGTVNFLDHDLTSADDAALTRYRREHVGFVFQFYNLIPSLTARENVALVTEIADHPMPPEEELRLVGLGDRLDHFPAQLSGGEQQRVAVGPFAAGETGQSRRRTRSLQQFVNMHACQSASPPRARPSTASAPSRRRRQAQG
jgi:ABC-type glutathione transport system ATPase component